jgi:hypothetical protein
MVFKTLLIVLVFAVLMEDSLSIKKTAEEEKEDREIAEKVNATLAEEAEKKKEAKQRDKTKKKDKKDPEESKKAENKSKEEDGEDEACLPANCSCPIVKPCPPCQDCPACKECGPCHVSPVDRALLFCPALLRLTLLWTSHQPSSALRLVWPTSLCQRLWPLGP